MKPLVSIILVLYNGYADTIECIKSLKKVHYDNYNITVVDNASTTRDEKAIEYLKENSDYIVSPNNCGFSGGNNIGIKYCMKKYNSDYFLLLNNDTTVEPDFIDELLSIYSHNEHVGIACGKILYYDFPDLIWYAGGTFDQKYAIADHCLYNKKNNDDIVEKEIEFATGCLLLIPKYIFDTVGYLSEEYFLYAEDTDFSRRVRKSGYKIVYNSKAIIYHKVSKSTKTSELISYYMVRNNLYIIKKYANSRKMAYFKYAIFLMKAIIKREIQIKSTFKGIYDFLCNKKGKKVKL